MRSAKINLTLDDLTRIQPAVQAELCKRSLIEFGEKIGHIVDAEKFRTPAHIRLIAEHLEAVERGDIDRLIIALPPRHGKSMLASKIFPLWCMGRNPHNRLIVCSYGADLAQSFTRSIRNTINTQEYKKIFPLTILADDSQAQNRFDTTAGGSVHGVGVGGAITGKGADIVIIDDPIKNSEEASSEQIREKVYEFYRSTIRTRLQPGGRIILIQTRWNDDDLAGRLLQTEPDNWKSLILPALSVDGCALWPEQYPADVLDRIKKEVGEKIFEALYQQNPIDVTERLFKDPQFADIPDDLILLGYLDPAYGGNDYSALVIGGIKGGRIYIVAGYAWQGQIDMTYTLTERACKAHNIRALAVECNGAGSREQAIIGTELQRRGVPCIPIINAHQKHLRIVNYVKKNWNHIYFNRGFENTEKSAAFMNHVLKYSELAKYDDSPDALAGLIASLLQKSGTRTGHASINLM